MSYTPDKKEIRRVYSQGTTGEPINEWADEFDQWYAAEIAAAKAEAWDEAYRQGIEDERTAEALKVDIGVGGYATANRSNPYRADQIEES